MMDFDAAWCPSCDRLIAPKRYQVPIEPAVQQPSPAPPPSPQSSPSKKTKGPQRKGGLASGTGRVRPNGTIKPPPQQPVRYRTVIDQSPQGLYCSDECRLADLHSTHNGRPTHPDRFNPRSAPVSIPSSSNKPKRTYSAATLAMAEIYNFPTLPDLDRIPISDSDSEEETYTTSGGDEWSGGMMMAGRRLREVLAKPVKARTSRWDPAPEVAPPVPGWTDGSNAWRASVYQNAQIIGDPTRTKSKPVRTRRVRACVDEIPPDPTPDLFAQFSETLIRRAESRISPSSPSGSSTASAPVRRERSLLPPGAEGKLLVPDVKLKVRASSSASLSSTCASPASSQRSVRSPLLPSDPEDHTPLRAKRPAVETRSWSYDNMLTYPVMPHPKRIVKTKQLKIVDGKEVEVVVEVEKEAQKLFLFPAVTRS